MLSVMFKESVTSIYFARPNVGEQNTIHVVPITYTFLWHVNKKDIPFMYDIGVIGVVYLKYLLV